MECKVDLAKPHFQPLYLKEEKPEDDPLDLEFDVKDDIIKEETVEGLLAHPSEISSQDDTGNQQKICGVCGHSAKNNHFGAICCDSCRAFFRRSVQSNTWQIFYCLKNDQCDIQEDRRCCQSCRFKRCQSIGMDMTLVLTEDDRKALMVRKIEKRKRIILEHQLLQAATHHQNGSDPQQPLTTFSDHVSDNPQEYTSDADDIHVVGYDIHPNICKIQNLQEQFQKRLSFHELSGRYDEDDANIIEDIFFIFCQNMGKFFTSIPEFQELDTTLRNSLLKPAIAKAVFIIGTHQFNNERNCWPRKLLSPSCSFPVLKISTVENFFDDYIIMQKWKEFIAAFAVAYSDEIIVILTLVVALFSHKNLDLARNPSVHNNRLKYIQLIEFYIEKHYPNVSVFNTISVLLNSLNDIEELKECFQNPSSKDNSQAMHNSSQCYNTSITDEDLKFPSSHHQGNYRSTPILESKIGILKDNDIRIKKEPFNLSATEEHLIYIPCKEENRESPESETYEHSTDSNMSPLTDHEDLNRIHYQERELSQGNTILQNITVKKENDDDSYPQVHHTIPALHQFSEKRKTLYMPGGVSQQQAYDEKPPTQEFHQQCPMEWYSTGETIIKTETGGMMPNHQIQQYSSPLLSDKNNFNISWNQNPNQTMQSHFYEKLPQDITINKRENKVLEMPEPSALDKELFKAIQNILPSHLGEHLAAKISRFSKDNC